MQFPGVLMGTFSGEALFESGLVPHDKYLQNAQGERSQPQVQEIPLEYRGLSHELERHHNHHGTTRWPRTHRDGSGPSWPITFVAYCASLAPCRRRSRPCPPQHYVAGYVRLKLLTGPRCLLAIQIEKPGWMQVVLLRLTLKRPQTASCSSRSAGAHTCLFLGSSVPDRVLLPLDILRSPLMKRPVAWYGTNSAGAFVRVLPPKVRLRLPSSGRC